MRDTLEASSIGTCGEIEKGVRFDPSDFATSWSVPSNSFSGCCSLCEKDINCEVWTWIQQDGACDLGTLRPNGLLERKQQTGSASGRSSRLDAFTGRDSHNWGGAELIRPGEGDEDVVSILVKDKTAMIGMTPKEHKAWEQTQQALEKSSQELGLTDQGHEELNLDAKSKRPSAPVPARKASTESTSLKPVSKSAVEWIVTYPGTFNVRAKPNMQGKVIAQKPKGAVVIGKQNGEWLTLLHEPGYMRISLEGEMFLRKRHVQYTRLQKGKCRDLGQSPINDGSACQEAGSLFGYPGKLAKVVAADLSRPEGCQADGRQLWMQVGRGRGVATRDRRLFCSSLPYPAALLKPIAVTTTMVSPTTQTWGWPSLFCFTMATRDRLMLVNAQFRDGAGLFTCEEFAVFTTERQLQVLGPDATGRTVKVIQLPQHTDQAPYPNQQGNGHPRRTFMAIWDMVVADGRFRRHEWTVKVDLAAVFFPERLRPRLIAPTAVGGPAVLVNCNVAQHQQLLEALQVLSQQALDTYSSRQEECQKTLPWLRPGFAGGKRLAEGEFLLQCLGQLGVRRLNAFTMLADAHCHSAPCTDKWRVAFSNYSDIEDWFSCYAMSEASSKV